jgi:hypothetical protein
MLHGDLRVTAGPVSRSEGKLIVEWTRRGTRVPGVMTPHRVSGSQPVGFNGRSKLVIVEGRVLSCDDDWRELKLALERVALGGPADATHERRPEEVVVTDEDVWIGTLRVEKTKPK